jgi:hypothetical protein
MIQYDVGDKVRLLKPIWDDGADAYPSGYIAEAGDVVIVRAVKVSKFWDLYVSHEEITDNSFGVNFDEVKRVTS